jgi:putative transposase
VKYHFMKAHQQVFKVQRMCQVLQVSSSGFYDWLKRPLSRQQAANIVLGERIQAIHRTSRQTYGSPRIWAELQAQGVRCGVHRVARLMQHLGLPTRYRRRHRITTQADPAHAPAPNLLVQDFTAQRPQEKWLTDITYIPTREGDLYLAAVLDVCSRKIVGWSLQARMTTQLVTEAFQMALERAGRPVLHHSDRGSQYTSHAYRALLARHSIQVSMSGTGNCYDNAMMESFWATLKTEGTPDLYPSRLAARRDLFEFIELWYNRQRRHSALGYLSPTAFEQRFV